MATLITNPASSADAAMPFLLAEPAQPSRLRNFRRAYDTALADEAAAGFDRRNVRLRISYLLCRIGVQMNGASDGELPLTRFELAASLDVGLVPVKRALALLGLSGVIETTGSGIRVLDWHRLCAIAHFDPADLHLEPTLRT